ncbi:MAG: cytochrome c3 family protein [Syntrophales bacterium]|nr:cytochrome c3 family protein [Syntrophales bacterium]
MLNGRKRLSFFIATVLTMLFLLPGERVYTQQTAAGLNAHQKAGVSCEGCHQEKPPKTLVPTPKCMACHGDLTKLITRSAKAVPNPHASPHISPGEIPKCEECHHIHKPSEVSCLGCHQDFKLRAK